MIGSSSASIISETVGFWERGVGAGGGGGEKKLLCNEGEMYRRHSSVVSHTLGSGAPATGYSSSGGDGGEMLSCSKSLKSHGGADA